MAGDGTRQHSEGVNEVLRLVGPHQVHGAVFASVRNSLGVLTMEKALGCALPPPATAFGMIVFASANAATIIRRRFEHKHSNLRNKNTARA